MKTFREPDDQVEIILGEEFRIALHANPTTGYMWKPQYDVEALQMLGDSTFETDLLTIGNSGEEVFTFRSLREGSTTLKLNYQRSWEPIVQQIVVFEVNVISI